MAKDTRTTTTRDITLSLDNGEKIQGTVTVSTSATAPDPTTEKGTVQFNIPVSVTFKKRLQQFIELKRLSQRQLIEIAFNYYVENYDQQPPYPSETTSNNSDMSQLNIKVTSDFKEQVANYAKFNGFNYRQLIETAVEFYMDTNK